MRQGDKETRRQGDKEENLIMPFLKTKLSDYYNGSIVLEEMRSQINYTVLCAADPYAVVGVSQGFGLKPDLITGVATSTSAGVKLVEKLTGIKALTLPEQKSWQQLGDLLLTHLPQITILRK